MVHEMARLQMTKQQLRPLSLPISSVRALEQQIMLRRRALRDIKLIRLRLTGLMYGRKGQAPLARPRIGRARRRSVRYAR